MSKIDVSNWTIPAADAAKFSFTEPRENNIVFYNGGGAIPENEVMRIDRNGVRVNPKLSTDEAADAVIRALDTYIKNMMPEEQDPDELTRSYLSGVHDGKKQRTWVGLTNDECVEIAARGYPRWLEFAQAVEAKLKEKNIEQQPNT